MGRTRSSSKRRSLVWTHGSCSSPRASASRTSSTPPRLSTRWALLPGRRAYPTRGCAEAAAARRGGCASA